VIALLAIGATTTVVREDSWRTGLAAGLAAAAVAATRIRFALAAATVLLAIVALLAYDGRMPARDERPRAHDQRSRGHDERPATRDARDQRHRDRPARGTHRRGS